MVKLNVRAFGLACGAMWGGSMFLLGILDTLSTWGDSWGALMAIAYLGYKPTVLGSIIVGIWGFISAAIGGIILAWLYNRFSK